MASQVRSARSGSGWTNSENIVSNDGVYATHSRSTFGVGATLRAYNFGFSIPSGAIINGIFVRFDRRASSSNGVRTALVRVSPDATPRGSTLSTNDRWPTSDSYESWGGTSYLWDQSWTAEQINSADFSVFIAAYWEAPVALTAYIDHVEVTVYYTEPIGTVTGTVRDAATLQPLSGVTVSSDDGQSTTTNVNGVYTLSSVTPGSRQITFSRSGYHPKTVEVDVVAGDTVTCDVTLMPSIIPITLSVNGTSTVRVRRGVTFRVVSATSGQTSLSAKSILRRLFTAAAGHVGTVTQARTLVLLVATMSLAAGTLSRAVRQVLRSESTHVSRLQRGIRRTLAAITEGLGSVASKGVPNIVFSTTSSSVASIARLVIQGLLLTTASTSMTALRRHVGKLLQHAQGTTTTVQRTTRRHLVLLSNSSTSLTAIRPVWLRAVSTATTTLRRGSTMLLSVTSNAQQRMMRRVARLLSTTAGWVAQFDSKRLKLLVVASVWEATIRHRIHGLRRLFTAAAVILRKRRGR